jgi:hypothetical protein
MNRDIIVFNPVDGRIRQTGNMMEEVLPMFEAGLEYPYRMIYGTVPALDSHYVFNDELVPRAPLPVIVSGVESFKADGESEVNFTNLPETTIVEIDGEQHVVHGGSLTLKASIPAFYNIRIDHWPYLLYTNQIEARPA